MTQLVNPRGLSPELLAVRELLVKHGPELFDYKTWLKLLPRYKRKAPGHHPGEFDIIVIDCPWEFAQRCAHKKTKFGGGAGRDYPLMTDEDLIALGPLLQEVCARDVGIFHWSVGSRNDFCLDLLRIWGFHYATKAFDWVKMTDDMSRPKHGPGAYTSSNVEDVALGVPGDVDEAELEEIWSMFIARIGTITPQSVGGQRMVPQVVMTPRFEHSEKPEDVQDRIEKMYPGARKLEIFARRERPGWVCLGNQIGDCLDIRDALELAASGYYDHLTGPNYVDLVG